MIAYKHLLVRLAMHSHFDPLPQQNQGFGLTTDSIVDHHWPIQFA